MKHIKPEEQYVADVLGKLPDSMPGDYLPMEDNPDYPEVTRLNGHLKGDPNGEKVRQEIIKLLKKAGISILRNANSTSVNGGVTDMFTVLFHERCMQLTLSYFPEEDHLLRTTLGMSVADPRSSHN